MAKRTAAFYQWWHAELNRMLFDGKLEPAFIHVSEGESSIRAEFLEHWDPYIIIIYEDDDAPDMEQLTVLLHEMVHEYIHQFGILDDEHGPMFQRVTRDHGMEGIGYALNDDTHGRIEKRLESYNRLSAHYGTR